MTNMVPKKWDDLTVLVDEALLNRAKQLIKVYGITIVSPVARALEEEFHYPPCSDDVNRAMVIASRELHEEKTAPRSQAEIFDNIDKLTGLGQYKCTHRCMEGKNCGGCGCPGCGYTA